jgi:hypothetical protein
LGKKKNANRLIINLLAFLSSRTPLEIIEPLHRGLQAGGGVHSLVQIQASFSAMIGD